MKRKHTCKLFLFNIIVFSLVILTFFFSNIEFENEKSWPASHYTSLLSRIEWTKVCDYIQSPEMAEV